MRHDDRRFLHAERIELPPCRDGEEVATALQEELRTMGFATEPVDAWMRDGDREAVMIFEGVGDRRGEFCAGYFSEDLLCFHRFPSQGALFEGLRRIPWIAERPGFPDLLEEDGRVVGLAFEVPRPTMNRAERHARKRRRAA